jgi:MtN3 and saliva related transmembrane protein
MIELLAIIATILLIVAFIPQAIQLVKFKSTGEVTVSTYLFFWMGVMMWLVYGIFQDNIAIIV